MNRTDNSISLSTEYREADIDASGSMHVYFPKDFYAHTDDDLNRPATGLVAKPLAWRSLTETRKALPMQVTLI